MTRKRIGRHVSGGAASEAEGVEGGATVEALREALAGWPAGVTLVAVRAQGRVHALTVSAFMALSLEPPIVLVNLGPNASAAPYLDPGVEIVISLLAGDQGPLASRFADTFPVGPDPFPDSGPPVVEDALAALVCRVEEVLAREDRTLVFARVAEVRTGPEDRGALVWRHRDYRIVD